MKNQCLNIADVTKDTYLKIVYNVINQYEHSPIFIGILVVNDANTKMNLFKILLIKNHDWKS